MEKAGWVEKSQNLISGGGVGIRCPEWKMFEKEAHTAESGRKRELSKTFSQKLINGGGWNKNVLGGKFSKS